jgi:ubiquinone/menaquinone biosynthesis C-methylase UbiE
MNSLHPIAASLAIREQNRTNVLVDDASTYAAIASALEKMGFLNRDDSITERVASFPEPQRKTLERSFEERQEGNSFYSALAVYPHAPRILDIQYSKILDTIYLIKALLSDCIAADDPCLDIGTCTGVMPIILSSLCLGSWTGIDRSAACIEYAARSAKEFLEAGSAPSFMKGTLEKLSPKHRFKFVLNSRGPKMDPGANDYALVSNLLEENGIFVYVDTLIKNAAVAKKIYNRSGLSLVYRDVAGGFMLTPGGFEAACFSVFVKCKHELPEGDYRKDYESLWQSRFMDYCNKDVMDQPQLKTLCTMREHIRHLASG